MNLDQNFPKTVNPVLDLFERGFTIFTLIFFTGMLSFDSLYISPDPSLDAAEAFNPLYRLLARVQLLVYGLILFLVIARWRSSIQAALRNKLIWVMVALAVFSFLWSDFPDISSRKGFNVLPTSLFGLYMASRYSLKEQIRLVAYALGIVAIFSLLFSFAFRGAAIESGMNAGSWRGPFTQKNLLARVMVLSSLSCLLVALDKGRYTNFFRWGFLSSVGLLLLSGSKTALLVFLLLLVLLPIYRALRWQTTIVIPLLIVAMIILGSLSIFVVENWVSLLASIGRDPSLSGRTDLWEVALEKIMERPWLGYGFQGFWRADGGAVAVWKAVNYKPPHAHNGYINISLDLGLLGLVFFLLNIANLYLRGVNWLRLDKTSIGLFPTMYATFIFMYNHSENTIIDYNSIFWALFMASALSLRKVRAVPSQRITNQQIAVRNHSYSNCQNLDCQNLERLP